MFDLVETTAAALRVQTVPSDPGVSWVTDVVAAIEPPPDDAAEPQPDVIWPADVVRSGLYGVVSPRIVGLPEGGYRLYYTQIMPRTGFPAGANDYDNASSRILSATSVDGTIWSPESGVRLSPEQGGAGEFRVVSSEVVPIESPHGRYRMYYECCRGPQAEQNSIRSAISQDGLDWSPEAETRLETPGVNYMSPRIVILPAGRWRLYCHQRDKGIISALSDDGLTFRKESGIRIAPDTPQDRLVAFAPEIVRIGEAGYRMYYAGYRSATRAQILTAVSDDGLTWKKQDAPVFTDNGAGYDCVKASEMCLLRISGDNGRSDRYRMLFESCDGTAKDKRGVWRIAAATAVAVTPDLQVDNDIAQSPRAAPRGNDTL